jgi:hypothetical protein
MADIKANDFVANGKNPYKADPNITYIDDTEYHNELVSLYSNVLDASGINIKDPILANLLKYNRTQKRTIADPPYVGKTYIFVTRPDLNFNGGKTPLTDNNAEKYRASSGVTNIKHVELFEYFSKLEIGKQIMPFLMFPDGFVSSSMKNNYELPRATIGEQIIPEKYKVFTPFIPMISNLCSDSSGAKDLLLEVYSTEGDFYGNQLQYATGSDEVFTIGEITLNFKDIYGSPILHLINLWVHYIHYLCKGVVTTRAEYVRFRTIDYSCSIYIFMTDLDGSTITRWVKYTGCFPKSVPFGAIQHSQEPNIEGLRDLAITFAYNRYEVMTPKVLVDFNFIMQQFVNKNITQDEKLSRSPEALIKPELNPETYLNTFKTTYYPPITNTDDAGGTRILNKLDYDRIYWARNPYILDGKLVWV